jgi:glycopeptide antibiotics resistance protein
MKKYIAWIFLAYMVAVILAVTFAFIQHGGVGQ